MKLNIRNISECLTYGLYVNITKSYTAMMIWMPYVIAQIWNKKRHVIHID